MNSTSRNTIADAELHRTAAAWHATGGNISAAARQLGLPRSTVQHRLRLLRAQGLAQPEDAQALRIAPAPSADEPIEELLARKKARLTRERAAAQWSNLIPVQVAESRPIAVCLVGDPHIDDDGCDIAQLEHDLTTVGKTAGMYAGHVGDLTNNWVGRLARLYAHQSTSFADSLRLMEWMLGLCRNLFLVGGNHDSWSQGMDLVRFIARQANNAGPVQAHGARLALRWPDGSEIRVHARHDFPGKSQFSDTHGMKRELLWGHRDHILVAGHLHVDEARIEPSLDGEAHWMFRVSGYKVLDEYAAANHLRPKRLAPSVSVVLDPSQAVPAERVKPFWSVESAADYLSFVRRRK
jgi:transposase-like protein